MMRIYINLVLGAALLLLSPSSIGAATSADMRLALNGVWKIAQPRALLSVPTKVPFTPVGRRAYHHSKAAAGRGDFGFDPTMSRCSSPGMPRIMLTDQAFKIFVRADVISIMFAWNRLLRQIDMRGSPSAREWGSMMGNAWGSWDKDTLVIESRNFERGRLLDGLIPNSEQLRIKERLKLIDAETLEDRITITDPEMFTRSWEAVVTYRRQPNQTFAEDVCLDRKAAGQAPWPLPHAPQGGTGQ